MATNMLLKNFRVLYSIGGAIKSFKFNTENELFFSEIDLGLVGSRLCFIVDKQRLTKDGGTGTTYAKGKMQFFCTMLRGEF